MTSTDEWRLSRAPADCSSSIPPPGPFPDEPPAIVMPESHDPRAWMRRHLFERRVVLMSGTLDDGTANEVGASLMTLDAMGDDPVYLQMDSGEGTTGAALTLMDIIDLCGVPVLGTGIGYVAGPVVGVFAVCSHRTLSPNARVRLFEPPVEVAGNAAQLQHLAQTHVDRWAGFCSRVSAASGQPEDRVHRDAASGRYFSAQEAIDYGLADEVATPDAPMRRLPSRPIGFGPR
ncbi:MAG: ATP-dependent Clp protease proteolytic subunit [Acidimicrobiales bacterium]